MTEIRTPTETDVLRFVVAMCSARDDEGLVKEVIDRELEEWPSHLHASLLRVALRVSVAQMYGVLARRIDREMPGFIDHALQGQAAQNEGMPWG